MQYRNSVRTSNSSIDCEINHPQYGWIPFTANPKDTGAQFNVATLYTRMANDPATIPWDGVTLPQE